MAKIVKGKVLTILQQTLLTLKLLDFAPDNIVRACRELMPAQKKYRSSAAPTARSRELMFLLLDSLRSLEEYY